MRRYADRALAPSAWANDRLMPARATERSAKIRTACSSFAVIVGAVAFVAGIGLAAMSRLMIALVKDYTVDDGADGSVLPGPRHRPPLRDEAGR